MGEKHQNNILKYRKTKVLVAPLDWGLGHATRCIPIIKEFTDQGAEVLLAGSGAIGLLLKREFPQLKLLNLEGYNIYYSRLKRGFLPKLVLQSPKILSAISKEHNWIERMVTNHSIDIVVSDNRFGCWSKKCYNIYITHQLQMQTPHAVLSKLAQKVHYNFINKFSECWVPDDEVAGFAGALAKPSIFPDAKLLFIGTLSRLRHLDAEENFDVFVSISGPEPQRSIFEKILVPQLRKTNLSVVFVRGLPGNIEHHYPDSNNLRFFNHLPLKEYNAYASAAKIIIARAGYSTIMDLIALRKKAIIVATPGQTEQEYLAKLMEEKKMFVCAQQENFNLPAELEKINNLQLNIPAMRPGKLSEAVAAVLSRFQPAGVS